MRIRGARTDTRVDARNAEVILEVAQPAPVAVYSEGERVDRADRAAAAASGSMRPPPPAAKSPRRASWPAVTTEGNEQHASGAVNGGGPTITLRSTQGEIVVRDADDPAPAERPAPPRPPRPPSAPKLERKLEPR